jgi:oligopeptide/dipeptide ABC transporter ATP-binding protein
MNAVTDPAAPSAGREVLLQVQNLVKHFPLRRGLLKKIVGQVRAVDGVSFEVREGETLALVGESGSGKTTTGRCLLRLIEPTRGHIRFEGKDILALGRDSMRNLRRKMQTIFQDPQSSLNPRMKVRTIVGEPLVIHRVGNREERAEKTAQLLRLVGLDPSDGSRYPHEFSGGQRQRIGIARALALSPRFIVADEPVSSLDVSIQAQIMNLLMDLQEKLNLSFLFIAHDLRVVEHASDRVAVMYLGKIVEMSRTGELFNQPAHPYTQALLASIPEPVPEKKPPQVLEGDQPSPLDPPPGCRFHTRCPLAVERCRVDEPPLGDVGGGHLAACHLVTPE